MIIGSRQKNFTSNKHIGNKTIKKIIKCEALGKI